MVQDVKKAYFYAPATRDVYVDLPPERAEPGMCAKLKKSLYGTRDAALNWSQAYSEVLEGLGFVKGALSLCSFYHAGWQVREFYQKLTTHASSRQTFLSTEPYDLPRPQKMREYKRIKFS